MKPQKTSLKSRAFQWSFNGWLGGQIGGICWLLLLGILLLFHKDITAGISFIVCFLLLNAIGAFLWHRRDKIAPYPATQTFIALVGGLSALTITLVDWAGYFPHGANASDYTKWLLIVPVLMVVFHFQERSSNKKDMTN